MEDLKRHEGFEIEVLEELGRVGFLKPLVFGGGTMLRLCHELPRYSVDMDFWFLKKTAYSAYFLKLRDFLKSKYELSDSKNKHFTLLYEFRGKTSPRKLKIEIRKELLKKGIEDQIAYSTNASKQVLVRALSLTESARRKLEAIRSRDEVRDYFDLEFLLRKGVDAGFTDSDRSRIRARISRFRKSDITSVLGALLAKDLRDYYAKNGFAYLLEKISA